MNEEHAREIALFRYEYVYPIVSGTYPDANQTDYYNQIAQEVVRFPDGRSRIIRPGTLREWLLNYRSAGIEGLKPKIRQDKGLGRGLTTTQQNEIRRLKETYPKRTATSIHQTLKESGYYPQGAVSLSTVQRYLSRIKPELDLDSTDEVMRAFEMAHVNELWQIDTTHGPYLTLNGKKRKVYIVAIIDDASRFLVGYGLYFEDNALNVQLTLKRAIQTYGLPRRIYTDNGGPYIHKQLQWICASLKVGLNRARPYRGSDKGKIERWFGVMKDQWMHTIDWLDFKNLDQLTQSFDAYVVERNHQINRSIGQTPFERFMKEATQLRKIDSRTLQEAFLHFDERKIAKDGTIQLNKTQYEVPQGIPGDRVMVRFQPDYAAVYHQIDTTLQPIQPVNKVANGQRLKRRQIRLSEQV